MRLHSYNVLHMYCFHVLCRFTEARDFGEKSLSSAKEADDQMWQLNASVLIAQAECEQTIIVIILYMQRNYMCVCVQFTFDSANNNKY